MAKVISITNHKGGVGKTTTTANLGAALALSGKKTLLIDFDPQGNLSEHFSNHHEMEHANIGEVIMSEAKIEEAIIPLREQLFLVRADLKIDEVEKRFSGHATMQFKLKTVLEPIADQFDFILIDCPPSIGFFTINALVFSDEVIVTAEPAKLSMIGLETTTDMIPDIQLVNPKLKEPRVLLTKTKNSNVQKTFFEVIRTNFDTFSTHIRSYKDFEEAALMGTDIFSHAENSKAASDYRELAMELV